MDFKGKLGLNFKIGVPLRWCPAERWCHIISKACQSLVNLSKSGPDSGNGDFLPYIFEKM